MSHEFSPCQVPRVPPYLELFLGKCGGGPRWQTTYSPCDLNTDNHDTVMADVSYCGGMICHRGFSQDLAGAPGPGKYNATGPDVYKKKAPGYSMGARTYMPSDRTKKPGVDAVGLRVVLLHLWHSEQPAFSLCAAKTPCVICEQLWTFLASTASVAISTRKS